MSLFDDEPSSGRLNPANCVGHLLMVWAIDYIEHSPTRYSVPGKNSDVIVVDCVNLDEPDHEGYQGLIYRNVWWRNGRLISFLKTRIGRPKPVLARMAVGVATMGKPPYELILCQDDSDAVGRASAWFEAHPDFRPGAPVGGHDSERVQAEEPLLQQKSQLQQFAEQSLTQQVPGHQQLLRDVATGVNRPVSGSPATLPPARPAGAVASTPPSPNDTFGPPPF